MKKKYLVSILAIVAILGLAMTTHAAVSAQFTERLQGADYVPNAVTTSVTHFRAGVVNFHGSMDANMTVVNGNGIVSNYQGVTVGYRDLFISTGVQANASSPWYGLAATGGNNSTSTYAPGALVFTNDGVSALTVGSGTAGAAASSLVIVE